MNSVFTFVLLIVAIVMCTGVMNTWIKTRREGTASDEQLDEMLGKMEMLEERVRVLERIITEKKIDLREEIDRL